MIVYQNKAKQHKNETAIFFKIINVTNIVFGRHKNIFFAFYPFISDEKEESLFPYETSSTLRSSAL